MSKSTFVRKNTRLSIDIQLITDTIIFVINIREKKVKKIGPIQLGLSFAGCFLGAGYVSGQELWQFFGSFGAKGFLGLALTMLLLYAVGVVMIRLNQETGLSEVDKLIVRRDISAVRIAVCALELVFLFGVSTIMAAGVGALLNQLFGIPTWIGCALFTILVAVVSLAGFEGMVKAFSVSVPILVGATFLFGVAALVQGGMPEIPRGSEGSNPLMGSWFIAAISFACYNVFGSIAMVAPLGEFVKDKKCVFGGIGIGAAMLIVIALSVLISVCAEEAVIDAELPMLALASAKAPYLGYVYGMLLLLAMFGTSLSSLVAFTNMLCLKSEKINSNKLWLVVIYALGMFFGSLFGFGELISIIYPLFGYCSSVFIVLMVVHYIKVRKTKKAEIK